VRATKDEAGETPGDSVADDLRQEAASRASACSSLHLQERPLPQRRAGGFRCACRRKAKRKLTDDDLSLWRVGTACIRAVRNRRRRPASRCSADPRRRRGSVGTGARSAARPRRTIWPRGRGRRLLVAEERSGAHPIVVDLHSRACCSTSQRRTRNLGAGALLTERGRPGWI